MTIQKIITDKVKDDFIYSAKKIQWNLESVHEGMDIEKGRAQSLISFWDVYIFLKRFVEKELNELLEKILKNASLLNEIEYIDEYNRMKKIIDKDKIDYYEMKNKMEEIINPKHITYKNIDSSDN